MELAISSGHGLKVRGAKGPAPWGLDEVDENRRVVDRVAALLRGAGQTVHVFHDNTSTNVSANLNAIVNFHNSRKRDRDISCHFNAFQVTSKAMGTECLYKTQQALAANISKAMATHGGFINRGAKLRNDLRFLNSTAKPAVLLEVAFVDSSHDAALYKKNFEAICRGIAESIAGIKLPGVTPEPEPPPPEPPTPEPPPVITGEHVVDVSIEVKGNPTVVINGDLINDGLVGSRLELTLAHKGDILVTVDGEDFQIEPSAPTPSTRPLLRRGAKGDQVRLLQTALGVRPIDGDFGPITENAVKAFQREHGLTVDGIVGVQTWTKLEGIYTFPPYEPPSVVWLEDIKTSVFGGSKDKNNSAYPPFDFINDTERSVALPWKFQGARPHVVVRNRANGREVICQIRDVGPWLIDDNYWELGTRPLAEISFKNKTPLPRGPHKGKIANGAGLDVTPGAAAALGISGMAQCDWKFADADTRVA